MNIKLLIYFISLYYTFLRPKNVPKPLLANYQLNKILSMCPKTNTLSTTSYHHFYSSRNASVGGTLLILRAGI